MNAMNKKPLNGQPFNSGTTAKTNHRPSKPLNNECSKKQDQGRCECEVVTVAHGLVISIKSASSEGFTLTKDVVRQVLLKDNIFEDILKEYSKKVVAGSIEVGNKGLDFKNAYVTSTPEKIAAESVGSVVAKRVFETKEVKKIIDPLKAATSHYASEIWQVFVNFELGKIFLVVGTVATVAGGIVGYVQHVHNKKNDGAANAIGTAINWLPEKLFDVGELNLHKNPGKNDYSISGGITQFEWKPSTGQWNAKAYVAGEWQTLKDLRLKGRVELLGSSTGNSGKLELGAVYRVGHTYLDSVEGQVGFDGAGKYELLMQFNKTIAKDGDNSFDIFVGAKYRGDSGVSSDLKQNRGFMGTAGFKINLK